MRKPWLRSAILGLLDHERSSIIVVLNKETVGDDNVLEWKVGEKTKPEKRIARLQEHKIEEMRANVKIATDSFEDLSSESLQAVLGVDGIHCVSPTGSIVALGLRAVQTAELLEKADPGSGTTAARALTANPIFSGALIIKVSASGKIRYFKNEIGRYEVFQDEIQHHSFILKSCDGEKILTAARGYKYNAHVRRVVERIQEVSKSEENYHRLEDEEGRFSFHIKTRAGTIMGKSEWFDTPQKMEARIRLLREIGHLSVPDPAIKPFD